MSLRNIKLSNHQAQQFKKQLNIEVYERYTSPKNANMHSLIESIYSAFYHSKKIIPKTFELLEELNLSETCDYMIAFAKKTSGIPLTDEEKKYPLDNMYMYHSISSVDMLYYMKKYAVKNPKWKHGEKLDTDLFNKLLSPSNGYNLSHYIDMYIEFCKAGYVTPIENVYKHLKQYNFSSTKKDLNLLIDLFLLTKDEKFLPIFVKHHAVVSSVDPELSSVNIKALAEEIKKDIYSEDSKKMIDDTISEKNDFITDNDNRLTLTMDVEALSKLRKKNKLSSDGFLFIQDIESALESMYKENDPIYGAYITRTEEKNRIRHYIDTLRYAKQEKIIGESLKSFQFTYDDEKDKIRKKEVFVTLFKEAALLPNVNATTLKPILEKLIFTQKLNSQLDNSNTTEKVKRNKV